MNKHVPAEVSYKAARALAYLMTRKWWKELKDIYNSEKDGIRQESGLEIEDYILANANEFILSQLILWPDGKESTWYKRSEMFRKLWNNNFNSPEGTVDGPLFKVGDKVRIKERTEDEDNYWGCFIDEMAELAGKICTVVSVEEGKHSAYSNMVPDDGYEYHLTGSGSDNYDWFWASSMLEKA